MPVSFKINISTRLGENKFSGLKASWFQLNEVKSQPQPVIWGPANIEPVTTYKSEFKKKTSVIFENPNTINFSFADVPPGRHIFSIIRDDEREWRTGFLDIAAANESFEYNLFPLPEEQSSFTRAQLKKQIPLKKLKNLEIPGLDERLTITSRDIWIYPDHIEISGRGSLSKKDDWSITASSFDFLFRFKLINENPEKHTRKKLLYVVPFKKDGVDFEINFSNLLTGSVVSFKKEEIKNFVLDTFEKKINKSLDDIIDLGTDTLFTYQETQLTEVAKIKFTSKKERGNYIMEEMAKLEALKDRITLLITHVKHIVPSDRNPPGIRELMKNKLHILAEISTPAAFKLHAFLMYS